MNDKVKGIVAVVVIIIAVVLLGKSLKKDSLEKGLVVGCASCNKLYTVEVNLYETSFPLECKHCEEKTVYQMLKCQECDTVYHLIPGTPAQCTQCRSANVRRLKEIPK